MRPVPSNPWPFVGRQRELEQMLTEVADPEVTGVVLTAPAGSGKSRLAREVTGLAALPPLWLQGASAVAGVPFGALASVLGADEVDSAPAAFKRLAALAVDAGGVVVVDDAPHLDARSADLLHRLVAAGKATVVATARTGDPVPQWMEWLWLDERTRHHQVQPLSRAEVAELVSVVLGDLVGDLADQVTGSLSERSGGNPLFLRELVIDLADRRARGLPIDPVGEVPPQLLAVLEARLQAAGPAVVAALEAVAVLGSLPLELLLAKYGSEAVDDAERGGYLVTEGGAGAVVRPAHPLYAEAVLAALTVVARRHLVEEVARAVLEHGDSGLRLAAVTTLVENGCPVEVGDLLAGARAAFAALDHDLAAELATAAGEVAATDGVDGDGIRFESLVILGGAHSGADRSEQAEEALRAAVELADDDDRLARAVGRLSVHLLAHGHRVEEAVALVDRALDQITEPSARSFLGAERAKLASIRGESISLDSDLSDLSGDPDDPAVLNTAIIGAYTQAMAGDATGCQATIDAALTVAERHSAVLPWAGELVRFSGVFAALLDSGPAAARSLAAEGAGEALRGSGATVGTWRYLTGFSAVLTGDLARGIAELRVAVDELDGHDLIGARPLAMSAWAWAEAQAGRVEEARTLMDRVLDGDVSDARLRTQLAVADAWCDTVESVSSSAVAKVMDAAREAAGIGQVVPAVIVLHELVRMEEASQAIEPLRPLVRKMPDSWLARVITARVEVESGGGDRAVDRLLSMVSGRWPVVEAEVHLRLAAAAARRHDDVGVARHALASDRAMDSAELRPWTLRAVESPLTPRESQVVSAVLAGAGNREIAASAGVSVRTVENQLQSVYRKLGIGGRAELAALLEPTPAGSR